MKLSKVGKGRIGIYVPDHPKANSSGYVLRYRYNMEQYLGRYLESNELVHHCNENKTDDGIENLELMLRREHTNLHGPQRLDRVRKLDYDAIASLRKEGLGFRRIAKALNYPLSSVKSAVWKIERGSRTPWRSKADIGAA